MILFADLALRKRRRAESPTINYVPTIAEG
jgi:hypothetical protein